MVADPVRTPANRIIQGLLLLAGAGLLEFAVGGDRIAFHWTPLILGLTYLVAALVDGPRGGYWATALALSGWGLAVAYLGEVRPPDVDVAGAYLAGVGLAGVAAAVLRGRGVALSDVGFALTVAGAGLVLALSPRFEALVDATTYAIALGAVGIVNVVAGAARLRPGARAAT